MWPTLILQKLFVPLGLRRMNAVIRDSSSIFFSEHTDYSVCKPCFSVLETQCDFFLIPKCSGVVLVQIYGPGARSLTPREKGQLQSLEIILLKVHPLHLET